MTEDSMSDDMIETRKITQIELDEGWHTVVGPVHLSLVWLTLEVFTVVFRFTDDQGRSFLGGFTKIKSARADGMEEKAAMGIVERGAQRLIDNRPPYRDTALAREVRSHPDSHALIDAADRLDNRHN